MRNICFFLGSIIVLILVLPAPVWAHPVITEVMWMGSDVGTTDEWLEIMNPDEADIDVSGWTVTSLNSSAKEIVAHRFASGTVLHAGEVIVLASKAAANSRLADEPFAVSATLTLPNTKLLLRIRDATDAIIDEADDGSGTPFAGDKPSGTEGKASMERIDLTVTGTVKENWRTSTESSGFDAGPTIFGTPGSHVVPEPAPPLEEPPPETAAPTPCSDPLEIAIAIQSGPLLAVGKATVNFQAVATEGSLSGVVCSWNYGDGFTSQSCNPPTHSFTVAGTYTVRLEAKNQCDNTLVQEQVVTVQQDPSASGGSASPSYYDGSRLLLVGALPNPEGTDTGKEWIEIRNVEDRPVDLRDWKISLGETSYTWYSLSNSIGPRQTLRIYNSELKFTLPNSTSRLRLVTPSGIALSGIPWPATEEGRVYYPDDLKEVRVSGRVMRVTGPLTFQMELQPEAASYHGEPIVNVVLIGLETLEIDGQHEYLRALIEGKNLELEFDTYLWDDLGRLQVYAYVENIVVHHQLIVSKLYKVDGALEYKKKSEFKEFEKSVWKGAIPEPSYVAFASEEPQRLVPEVLIPQPLLLSEIYPSAFPKPKDGSPIDWRHEEWMEIENPGDEPVDLTGWSLEIGTKKKPFPSGLPAISGSILVLKMSSIKMSLKNAGDTVRLLRPDGVVVSEISYPALKNGLSFSAADDHSFCITVHPTPGEKSQCVAPATPEQKAAARKVAAKATAVKKAAAKVKANAAAYEVQVETSGEGEPIILSPHSTSSSVSVGLFGFIMGALLAMGVGMFVLKRDKFFLSFRSQH